MEGRAEWRTRARSWRISLSISSIDYGVLGGPGQANKNKGPSKGSLSKPGGILVHFSDFYIHTLVLVHVLCMISKIVGGSEQTTSINGG